MRQDLEKAFSDLLEAEEPMSEKGSREQVARLFEAGILQSPSDSEEIFRIGAFRAVF